MNVEVLPSARTLDAQSNFEAFVARAKKSAAFGNINFDNHIWHLEGFRKGTATEGGKRTSTTFYFVTGRGAVRGAGPLSPMQQPFADFVKSVVRLSHEAAVRRYQHHTMIISVCRDLHDALADVDYDPCRALPLHFTKAVRAFRARTMPSTANQGGAALARVASMIDKYGIGRVRLGWKNPIAEPPSSDRMTDEAAIARASKLPDQASLEALPHLAQLMTEPRDILRMRVIELLVCGGWRINEVLEIPADCEVEEERLEDGRTILRYGLRYIAAKGFGPTIKWIPTAMVDVARRAIADARAITAEVRADAEWMQQNTGRHPLFANQDGETERPAADFARMLGFSTSEAFRLWVRNKKIPFKKRLLCNNANAYFLKVRDVEAGLLQMFDAKHIIGKIPIEKCLFLVRQGFFHEKKGDFIGTVERIPGHTIRSFLSNKGKMSSIFERFDRVSGGNAVSIRPHQFRHWLNTLAQDGGMSQEVIARWFGRKDIKQNAVYDHISGVKLAEKVRSLAEAGELVGPLSRVRKNLPPADRNAFMRAQVMTGHVTELGLCFHDWSLVPCLIHGQCSQCIEHLVEKGNASQWDEAVRQAAEVEGFLRHAEQEDAEGTYGASRWVEAHRRRLDSLRRVIAVHEDDSIPDGTLVNLEMPSPGKGIIATRKIRAGSKATGRKI